MTWDANCSPRPSARLAANWALVPPGCPGSGSGTTNSDAPETCAETLMPLPGSCW